MEEKTYVKFKTIRISEAVYYKLKARGAFGDSWGSLLEKLLAEVDEKRKNNNSSC